MPDLLRCYRVALWTGGSGRSCSHQWPRCLEHPERAIIRFTSYDGTLRGKVPHSSLFVAMDSRVLEHVVCACTMGATAHGMPAVGKLYRRTDNRSKWRLMSSDRKDGSDGANPEQYGYARLLRTPLSHSKDWVQVSGKLTIFIDLDKAYDLSDGAAAIKSREHQEFVQTLGLLMSERGYIETYWGEWVEAEDERAAWDILKELDARAMLRPRMKKKDEWAE